MIHFMRFTRHNIRITVTRQSNESNKIFNVYGKSEDWRPIMKEKNTDNVNLRTLPPFHSLTTGAED